MSWILRFVALATLLAVPAWLLSRPWQSALGAIAAWVLSGFGVEIEMSEVQIMAPFEIGIFLAMCVASRRAPARERRRAMEWGTPLLVALEVATVVGAVALYLGLSRRGEEAALRAMSMALEFVPWASAITAWLLLLGRHELPAAVTAGGPARRPAGPRAS